MRSSIVLGFLALSVTAQAQGTRGMTTERVRFEPGASGATLTRSTDGRRLQRYTVDVRGGQRMTVQVDSFGGAGWVTFEVYAPGRPAGDRYAAPSSDGARADLQYWTGQLSRSGRYQVVVRPMVQGEPVDYDVTILVE